MWSTPLRHRSARHANLRAAVAARSAPVTRCAVDGCDEFAEHLAGTDERLWCDRHCPDCQDTPA